MMILKVHKYFFLCVACALLSSCAVQVKERSEDKKIKPLVEPVSAVVAPVETQKKVLIPVIPERQDVLILLSSTAKPYIKLADDISAELGERSVQIILSGLPAQDRAVIEDIKASNTIQIVAIGLKAVNAVKHFKNKQIIYTQVIKHKKILADNVKAVSSLPSPEKLFKDWKILSPGLSKVAIVTGKNLDAFLQRAKRAAKQQGITLIVEQVDTDKSFIYKSKKLKADVGGQWILPDNRVLSVKALKEVMAYSSRRGRQIVVFSPKLLPFGGFLSVSPDLNSIAKGVLQRLSDSEGKTQISGVSVLPVMHHKMEINKNIARQFNLTIPDEYRKFVNEN